MSVYHVSSVERAKGGDVLVNLADESWPVFYDVGHVGAVDKFKGAPVGEVFIYVVDFELAIWGGQIRVVLVPSRRPGPGYTTSQSG